MIRICLRRMAGALGVVVLGAAGLSGCGWRGLKTRYRFPHRGAAGRVHHQAQLPDVNNIEQNSRVPRGDVTVGNVTRSSARVACAAHDEHQR